MEHSQKTDRKENSFLYVVYGSSCLQVTAFWHILREQNLYDTSFKVNESVLFPYIYIYRVNKSSPLLIIMCFCQFVTSVFSLFLSQGKATFFISATENNGIITLSLHLA